MPNKYYPLDMNLHIWFHKIHELLKLWTKPCQKSSRLDVYTGDECHQLLDSVKAALRMIQHALLVNLLLAAWHPQEKGPGDGPG